METSLCMLLIFFQTAQNMAFSQVNASCLSPVQFFPLIRNLFQAVFRHMQHLPVKTQCFLQFGISCGLGNEKMGPETRRLHVPVKTQYIYIYFFLNLFIIDLFIYSFIYIYIYTLNIHISIYLSIYLYI